MTGWTLSASKDCRLRRRNGVTPCLRDLLKFAEKHKRRVRAVQIGACDGNFTMEPGDAFQKLAFRAAHVDALLVEPVPFLFAKLEENLRPWQAVRRRPRGSLVAVNGAVCAQEGAEELPFFFAAPRFALDFPHAKHWMKYQLGRLLSDKTIVMKIVGHLVKMADLADLERVEEQEASKLQVLGVGGVDRNVLFHTLKRNRTLRKAFKAFNWPPDLNLTKLKEKARSQYVANISPVKIPQSTFLDWAPRLSQLRTGFSFPAFAFHDRVPCLTPAALLRQRGPWHPQSVDVLMVDTEGMDAEVVSAWMNSSKSFRPSLVVYEHTHLSRTERKAMLARLGALGYTCDVSHPQKWADTICLRDEDSSLVAK